MFNMFRLCGGCGWCQGCEAIAHVMYVNPQRVKIEYTNCAFRSGYKHIAQHV